MADSGLAPGLGPRPGSPCSHVSYETSANPGGRVDGRGPRRRRPVALGIGRTGSGGGTRATGPRPWAAAGTGEEDEAVGRLWRPAPGGGDCAAPPHTL